MVVDRRLVVPTVWQAEDGIEPEVTASAGSHAGCRLSSGHLAAIDERKRCEDQGDDARSQKMGFAGGEQIQVWEGKARMVTVKAQRVTVGMVGKARPLHVVCVSVHMALGFAHISIDLLGWELTQRPSSAGGGTARQNRSHWPKPCSPKMARAEDGRMFAREGRKLGCGRQLGRRRTEECEVEAVVVATRSH